MAKFRTVAIGLAATLALGGAAPAARGETAAVDPAAPGAPVATYSVTLITGDTVDLQKFEGGRQVAAIRPGPGRETMGFEQLEYDGKLRVIPHDAVPYLAGKRLDADLFNITTLIENGYDDARRGTLPLILQYADGARATARPAAATTGAVLESIDAQAVTADKAKATSFWESLDDDRQGVARGTEQPRLASGVQSIRLDRKVKASLDRSVPQIGAPQVWESGYDGTGVKVAVLDTGIDDQHPDIAGSIVEAKNFSPSPTTKDGFGHGTHVASIVLGRGAGSTPVRKGVAPGAKLLAGKVLGDDGFGQESWIIEGMEWASSAGAKVINMSLGGGPTDGTDAMSQAVNRITAETGTLFVISAGNDGEDGEFTIGTPGTADAALTVGAIDRDESLAYFSSRGPRRGDFAIKPDVTAPGVGIVAARAAGTSMGSPVDQHYTGASGTSMAAPHVAGAAALLAQQHPSWTPEMLKDALASTAVRNGELSVTEQGAGRIDVAKASAQSVIGTATLNLGLFDDGDTGTVRKPVTYRNSSAADVTLSLRLGLDTAGVSLAQDSVVVPANGAATVDVLVDAAALPRGRKTAYLEATAGDTVVHTSVGVVKEAPKHKVTFTGIGRDGGQGFINPLTLFGDDSRFDVVTYIPEGHTLTAEVAEGTYYLHARSDSGVAPDAEDQLIVDPQLKVDKDMTVVLDARKANRIQIKTPNPAIQRGILSHYTSRELPSGRRIAHFTMQFDGTRYVAVTPTEPVTDGKFEFGSRWGLVAPLLSTQVRGVPGFRPEMFLLGRSPALAGDRRLPVVNIGPGRAEDYRGRDVRGKIALIHGQDPDVSNDTYVRTAADAGAALALIVPDPVDYEYTQWIPTGTRLATMGALIRRVDGARLLDLLEHGKVTVDLHGTPTSPYLYDVHQITEGQIPDQVVHTVSGQNSATVTTRYHESGGAAYAKEQRFSWRPWQTTSNLQYQRWTGTGTTRDEIVSAGDLFWMHRVKHDHSGDSLNPLAGGMNQSPVQYQAGQRLTESWFAPALAPAIPTGVGTASYREGDTFTLRVPAWSDADPTHYGLSEGGFGVPADKGAVRLFRDGVQVAQGAFAWGTFAASAEDGPRTVYRLEQDVSRTGAEWQFATRTQSAWTFTSASAAGRAALPLLQLDLDARADLRNSVKADRDHTIAVGVRHQDGLARPDVRAVTVWASYNDGGTWTKATVVPHGSRYDAILRHPQLDQTTGYVTLRVQARDAAGNIVDQTIDRAYGLR